MSHWTTCPCCDGCGHLDGDQCTTCHGNGAVGMSALYERHLIEIINNPCRCGASVPWHTGKLRYLILCTCRHGHDGLHRGYMADGRPVAW